MVHHDRKEGGDNGVNIAGGHAFLGIIDIALSLHRVANVKNRRRIDGLGRVIEIPSIVYELNEDGVIEVLGNPTQLELKEVKQRVFSAVIEEWQKTKEIRSSMENPMPSPEQIRRALISLAEERSILREPPFEKGKVKGATYKWKLK